jgi:signal transduction histidine kinase
VFTSNQLKKRTLLRYWTTRYLLTLCIGLLIITILSVFWIRYNTLQNNLQFTGFIAEDIADRIIYNNVDAPPPGPKGKNFILKSAEDRLLSNRTHPKIYILDANGKVAFQNRPPNESIQKEYLKSIISSNKEVEKVNFPNEPENPFYVVKRKIMLDGTFLGWVMIIQTEQELTHVENEYHLLSIFIISMTVLGWLAIYFLTRRLTKPIKMVSEAAKKVQEEDYNIDLNGDVKELEIYELVTSFKQMTQRLKQLESLRTELLAGVTHELKTPVTSISGLIQAVKDGVVKGDEAKEFLQMSLIEVSRMQKMVEDLLDFNSFSAKSVPLRNEKVMINDLVREIVHQWQSALNNKAVTVKIEFLPNNEELWLDPLRVQQIIVNLLNNGLHAMNSIGKFCISLNKSTHHTLEIDIQDQGIGIPEEEQHRVFERFYRGENKKYVIRGLGLGLPFSRMLAQALEGNLFLKESSNVGTIFTISLPIKKSFQQ